MKTFHKLQEGLYDPNIFKAFFLAGGPGSGKSYVAARATGGTGLKTVNSDEAFEYLLTKAGLSLKMPSGETEPRDVVRGRAKDITVTKEKNYIEGRLGLIIDGTGREADKILAQKAKLEELGYDTYMIFVNTSIDVALERNAKRSRSVSEAIVVKSWKDVQVDNNNAGEDIFKDVYRRVKGLLRKKVQNTRAKNWMASELARRQR